MRRRMLGRRFSVNVSAFFRPPDQFQRLREEVLPRLLRQRPRLRIWSAGCSFGAELYSLALLLEELTPGVRHDLMGSDIDEPMLARARAGGPYRADDMRYLPAGLRERYVAGGSVSPSLASRVLFYRHDLLSEAPPGGDFDLIVCRNVLMYFTKEAQATVLARLYDALQPDGFLFTGSTEAFEALPAAGFRQELIGFYGKGEVHARS